MRLPFQRCWAVTILFAVAGCADTTDPTVGVARMRIVNSVFQGDSAQAAVPVAVDVLVDSSTSGAGLSALAFLGALIFLKESLPPERRGSIRRVGRLAAIADKLGRPDLRGLILLSFLVILAFAGMEVTFAMWAFRQFHWGPLQVGLVFTFVGVISATMQGGLVGRLAKLVRCLRLA